MDKIPLFENYTDMGGYSKEVWDHVTATTHGITSYGSIYHPKRTNTTDKELEAALAGVGLNSFEIAAFITSKEGRWWLENSSSVRANIKKYATVVQKRVKDGSYNYLHQPITMSDVETMVDIYYAEEYSHEVKKKLSNGVVAKLQEEYYKIKNKYRGIFDWTNPDAEDHIWGEMLELVNGYI